MDFVQQIKKRGFIQKTNAYSTISFVSENNTDIQQGHIKLVNTAVKKCALLQILY